MRIKPGAPGMTKAQNRAEHKEYPNKITQYVFICFAPTPWLILNWMLIKIYKNKLVLAGWPVRKIKLNIKYGQTRSWKIVSLSVAIEIP